MGDTETAALRRELGLDEMDICWPESSQKQEDRSIVADHTNISPSSIQNMYAESDLSSLPLFVGGWINYGMWDNINYKNPILLTEEDRINSSRGMYEFVFNKMDMDSQTKVLEVGCGLGMGSALLANNYPIKQIIGIDITKEQILRALKRQQDTLISQGERLKFMTGAAEKLDFSDQTFSHVISIECAQHFRQFNRFISESLRVLKPNGSLAFAVVLAKDEQGLQKLKKIIPDCDIHMSDMTLPDIEKITTEFYGEVKIEEVGQLVWEGLDAWLIRQGMERQWSRVWLKAYQHGWLDYYFISARK